MLQYTWKAAPSLWGEQPGPRAYPCTFVNHKRLYVFGGISSQEIEEDDMLYYLDTETNKWAKVHTRGAKPNIAYCNAHNAVFGSVDNTLYVIAPAIRDGIVVSVALWSLNLTHLQWESSETYNFSPNFPWGKSAIGFDHPYIYVFGGVIRTGPTSQLTKMSVHSREWVVYNTVGLAPTYFPYIFTHNDIVYTLPGKCEGYYITSFTQLHSYSENDRYASLSVPLPHPDIAHSGAYLSSGHCLLMFGGYNDKEGNLNRIISYNINENSFSVVKAGGKPPPRMYGSSVKQIGSRFYLFGGTTGTHFFDGLYILEQSYGEKVKPSKNIREQLPEKVFDKIKSVLESARTQHKDLCDLAIVAKDGFVLTHKAIMAARCPRIRHLLNNLVNDKRLDIEMSVDSRISEMSYNSILQNNFVSKNYLEGLDNPIDSINLDEYTKDDIEKVVNYIYTDSITFDSKEEAERIFEIAYDISTSDLAKLCKQATSYAPKTHKGDILSVVKKFRSIAGSPIASDVFFVINNKQKVYAHRIILDLFSRLNAPKNLKYIEIKLKKIDSSAFVELCRLMYTFGLASASKSKENIDYATVLTYALELGQNQLVKYFNTNMINFKSIIPILKMFNENKIKMGHGYSNFEDYIRSSYTQLVKSKKTMVDLSKTELDALLDILPSVLNPLDTLWIYSNREDTEKIKQISEQIARELHTNNAIASLIAAHHTGNKNLRSICLDYILGNSSKLEQSSDSIKSLSKLSDSLTSEISRKLSKKMKKAKSTTSYQCTMCGITYDYVKKLKCSICKTMICETCSIKKVNVPKILGAKKRSADVCIIFMELSDDDLFALFTYVDNPWNCEIVCKRWQEIIRQREDMIYMIACKTNEWNIDNDCSFNSASNKTASWRRLFITMTQTKKDIMQSLEELSAILHIKKLSQESINKISFQSLEKDKYKHRLPNDLKEFYKMYEELDHKSLVDEDMRRWVPYSLNKSVSKFEKPIPEDIEMFLDITSEDPSTCTLYIIGSPIGGEDYAEGVWCDISTGKLWYTTLNIPEFEPLGSISSYLKESIKKLKELNKI